MDQRGNARTGEGDAAGTGGISAEGSGHKLENLKKVGEDSPYYSNLQENLGIGFSMNPVLVCPDPVYGITYLVNCGRDYFIYAMRDEKAEVAVELPAKALFCRNGELYFIVDDYGRQKLSGMKKGDIAKYQPTTGKVELLVSDEAYDMRVYPDGILYEQMVLEKGDGGGESYRFISKSYSFTTGEIAEIGSTIDRWENLTLCVEAVFDAEKGRYYDDYLFLTEDQKELMRFGRKSVIPMDLLGTEGRIFGDFLYLLCREKRKLYACNMKTGEIEPATEVLLPPYVERNDYIFYDGRFIFTDGFSVKQGAKEGTVLFFIDRYGIRKKEMPSAFFTDGTNLYGLFQNKLYRMEFTKWNPETQEVPGGFVWDWSTNSFEAGTDEDYLALCDPF